MGSVVRTTHGRIEGGVHRGVEVFRGVPYAAPPLEGLRFRGPEPPRPWRGIRSAIDFGPAAPQVGPVHRLVRALIGAAGSTQSQDCLYLNVWTPAADRRRRPVMVWLHGGAFILGSGSTPLYSGWRLARRGDVVVVTINYRLGVLGFASWNALGPGVASLPANLGLRDQIAALQWVRDNIEAFGGDPRNVTLFGESAGGMSVATLLGTPSAQGLFHKAIMQSGAAHNVWTRDEADRVTEFFLETLGKGRLREDTLLRLPVTELMRAQALTTARLGLAEGILAWQPSVDGELLPEPPLTAISRGLAAGIPVLVGSNRDEWKLFMAVDPGSYRLSEEELARRMEYAVRRTAVSEQQLAQLRSSYRFVRGRRGGEPAERWAALQSDRIFHYPATRLLELQADHSEGVFSYLFEWSPTLTEARLGACHGLELPFVFGSLRAAWLRVWLGASPRSQLLCDRIQDAWVAFARRGDPGHEGLPEWSPYARGSRSTMVLDGECTLRDDPHLRARECWDPLIRDAQPAWLGAG